MGSLQVLQGFMFLEEAGCFLVRSIPNMSDTNAIYRVQIFSVKHIQFIVKNIFKATCFGSTEPSSGLFVRTDSYLVTSNYIWICSYKKAWWWLCRAETCRLECVLNNKLDVFDWKNLHFVYIQKHIGLTNVKNASLNICKMWVPLN
jgi:hypothetical protein